MPAPCRRARTGRASAAARIGDRRRARGRARQGHRVACGRIVHGLSDALLLEQIVRNLVGNAVRYTESGGVLVSHRRRGERVPARGVEHGGRHRARKLPGAGVEEVVEPRNNPRASERTASVGPVAGQAGRGGIGHSAGAAFEPGRAALLDRVAAGRTRRRPPSSRPIAAADRAGGAEALAGRRRSDVREALRASAFARGAPGARGLTSPPPRRRHRRERRRARLFIDRSTPRPTAAAGLGAAAAWRPLRPRAVLVVTGTPRRPTLAQLQASDLR